MLVNMTREINNKESLDDADEKDNDIPVKTDKEIAETKTKKKNKTIKNHEGENIKDKNIDEDADIDDTEGRKNSVKTKTRKKKVKSSENDDEQSEGKQDIDEDADVDADVDETDGRRKKRSLLLEEDPHGDVEAAADAEIKKPANSLAAKKSVAQGMMDIALITANANQLRYMVEYNQHSSTFYINVILISVSLILQLAIGVALIYKTWLYMQGKSKRPAAKKLNIYVTAGVFVITIINVFIASFTVTGPAPKASDKR